MFGDYSNDLLRKGIIELKGGNRESARRYLDRALYMSSDPEVMAEAWYWMSQATDEPVEKHRALENCLANDLQHARARRELAILDGRLKPEEIIDPNALGLVSADPANEAQRFVCSRCGGRMVYAPDGGSLVCEYCRQHQAVSAGQAMPREKDFIVAMATRRGHSRPLREQVLRCQGCGAEFILPAGKLSFTCAYCDSAHVVSVERSNDLISPDGVLPHTFDQRHAAEILAGWMKEIGPNADKAPEPPRGLYLPLWSFVLGGGIDYAGERQAEEGPGHGAEGKTVQVRDRYPVMLGVSVSASRRASAPFVRLIPGYDLGKAQPYDARYLAAWLAELYDVSMAEASLEARSQAYAGLKRDLPTLLAPIQVTSTSSANLSIESFRLDLLPVWMTEASVGGQRRIVLINGQNGSVEGDGLKRLAPNKGKLMDWLGDLLWDPGAARP